MEHYKSWSALNSQLSDTLCKSLKGRIKYFLTRYHDVHNAYGRAAIAMDGKEIVSFSWIEMYHQERDVSKYDRQCPNLSYSAVTAQLKPMWDEQCTYCEMDFLAAALQFRNMSIQEALASDNYIIKIFAIMDRRLGKRSLFQIYRIKEFENYPDWVRQFYEIRLHECC